MRDIVQRASADRAAMAPQFKTAGTQCIGHFGADDAMETKADSKNAYDCDQESASSQDSGSSSGGGAKSDIPTYRSYQKYLDGYKTMKFRPMQLGKLTEAFRDDAEQTSAHRVDGREGKPRAGSATVDDAVSHKAELMIQINSPSVTTDASRYRAHVSRRQDSHAQPRDIDARCASSDSKAAGRQSVATVATRNEDDNSRPSLPPPPPPPPMMPNVLPARVNSQVTHDLLIEQNVRLVNNTSRHGSVQRAGPISDLKSCLLDELKAKHPPKDYQSAKVENGTFPRRTSEPIRSRADFKHVPVSGVTQHHKKQRQNNNDENHQRKPKLVPERKTFQLSPPVPSTTGLSASFSHHKNSTLKRHSETHAMPAFEEATITRVPTSRPAEPIDKSDPYVKKLVYATLRNYVGAYNNKANKLVAEHGNVVQDKGVSEQIRNITAQGPPPPPILSGNIPATRLKSEIGERRNEPPACVQNAMMTKDKKPFTYTPGGIDLSEIKSPRMARRIERNAAAPGVGELPQQPQYPQGNRPLPPSALAAMQPQLPIQVFPSGAPPPPPPPPVNAPPPPPMQPMPTKPMASNDGIYERPDMTRIIPENPMALLRKTPKVERKSFLDELTEKERQQYSPPMNSTPQPRSPQPQYNQAPQCNQQSQYNQQPHYSPQPQYQPSPQTPQYYSPQPQQPQQAPQYNRQPSYTTQPQPYSPQPQYYQQANSHPVAQMVHQPSLESNGPPSPPTKTSNVSIGSLYIPPINQQQQQVQYQQPSPKPQSPPAPPQRQPQSPQTPQSPIPKLNAAPKPWQNQQRKEPELPEWAQRHQQSPPKEETAQPGRMQVQPPKVTPMQMPPPPSRPGVEVVYVTQPEVYQHPGLVGGQRWVSPQAQQHMQQQQQQHQQQIQMQMQRQQQQQYMQQEMKGTRIIPIQLEGQTTAPNTSTTPERNLNRQQSWTPTQSNSFKVIQKMTENPNENSSDQQQVEYGPRTAQHFPADHMRKMHLNDSDREFMNRVKQDYINKNDEENPRYRGGHIPSRVFRYIDQSGVDEEIYLHNEPDPRYRGAAIPSKAFRMLQHLIDTPDHPAHGTPTVPQSPKQLRTNNIRTIPIQIEGEHQQPYVHPSQQTVEEPRKYMGSAIPSKAFQMLQAMTNSPAAGNIDKQSSDISDKNVAEINESSSNKFAQPPLPLNRTPAPSPYPMYGPNYYNPYWYHYYSYYYHNYGQNGEQENGDAGNQNWGYNCPSATPTRSQELGSGEDAPICSSCRNYYSNYYNQGYETDIGKSDTSSYGNTPAIFEYQYYWNPYYYSYYPPPPPPGYAYPYSYPLDGYEIEQQDNCNANYCKGSHPDTKSSMGKQNNTVIGFKPSGVEATPGKGFCDDRSETTIVDERESSNEEDGEVEEIHREAASNVPMIYLSSKTPNYMSDDSVNIETEMEEEEVDEVQEVDKDANDGEVQEKDALFDINKDDESDVETHSETSENDHKEQESFASVYINNDQMSHVLNITYEESERSILPRMDGESSVAGRVTQGTILQEEDDLEEVDKSETKVNAKLHLELTETNGIIEMVVDNVNLEESALAYDHGNQTVEAKLNNKCDAAGIKNNMVPVVAATTSNNENLLIRSRSNLSDVGSEIEIHMDDNRESAKSTNSEIKFDIVLTNLADIESCERGAGQEHEEIDFWSQINKEEDVLPKRQVFVNKYRDSIYSVDKDNDDQETKACNEFVNTTISLVEDERSSEALIESNKDTNSKTTCLEINSGTNHIVNKHEEEILTMCEEESNGEVRAITGTVKIIKEHTIHAQKVDNIEVTLDVLSDTQQEQTTTVDIKINDEQIEKLQMDECKYSNVVYTKEEIKQTLEAPKYNFGLDVCFMNMQNHLVENVEKKEEYGQNQGDKLLESERMVLDMNKEVQESVIDEDDEDEEKQQGEDEENDEEEGEEERVEENNVVVEVANKVEKKVDKIEPQKEENSKWSAISERKNLGRSKSKEACLDDREDNEINDLNNNTQEFYVPTIKERIRALQNASRNLPLTRSKPTTGRMPVLEVQDKDYLTPELIVLKSPKTSIKSSIRSVEDNSEDEIDSGVTSDISRHISDTESESIQEIRKIIKYQRAATHSRLYKLLQDECDEEEGQKMLQNKCDSITRKQSLSLPLKNVANPDGNFTRGEESGFNSPASPITDRQVNDLVSNLLRNKNAELKNVPIEMLQEVAFKILKEDKDCTDLSLSGPGQSDM